MLHSTPTTGYDPQMIKKLQAIRDRSWAYTWLHRENAQYLKSWYDRISYLNITLELLTATSIFVTASVCQNVYYVRILTGVMSIISGFISALLKHEDYGQEIMKHKSAASKYSRIYDTIDGQLSTPATAQQQAHHFHNWVSHEFDALFSTAPDLDEEVITSYTRKFGNRRPIHPIEAAEFEPDEKPEATNTDAKDADASAKVNNSASASTSVGVKVNNSASADESESADESISTDAQVQSHKSQSAKSSLSESGSRSREQKSEQKQELKTEPERDIEANKQTEQVSSTVPLSPRRKKSTEEAERQLKEYMQQMRKQSAIETFTPMLYSYQAGRMSMNTDKCYIDPYLLDQSNSRI